jgi:hypothetical protein
MAEYNICNKLNKHIYQASVECSWYVIFCFNLNRRFQYRSAVRIWLVLQRVERTLKEKKQWIIALLILESTTYTAHTAVQYTCIYFKVWSVLWHTHTHTHKQTNIHILVTLTLLFLEVQGCNIGPGRYYRDWGVSKILSVKINSKWYRIKNILLNSVFFQYNFYKFFTNCLIIHSNIG